MTESQPPAGNQVSRRSKETEEVDELEPTHTMITIPSEIIAEIFRRAPPPHKRIGMAPWTLGLVCHRWRQISFSCPDIWSYITISNATIARIDNPEDMVSEWIRRSGDYPLHITYVFSQLPIDLGQTLFNLLLCHSTRWRSLSIRPRPVNLHTAFGGIKHRFPMLESLSFYEDTPGTNPRFEGFDDCPRLRAVNFRISSAQTFSSLPWQQLTRVQLHHPKRFKNLLVSSLEDLTISTRGRVGVKGISRTLNRSSSPLRLLTLNFLTLTSEQEMLELYRSTPHLIGLDIEVGAGSVIDNVLSPLLVADHQCLLPKLQALFLSAGPKNWSYSRNKTILCDVVKRRCPGMNGSGASLSRLRAVMYEGELSQETTRSLETLRGGGLEIVLSSQWWKRRRTLQSFFDYGIPL